MESEGADLNLLQARLLSSSTKQQKIGISSVQLSGQAEQEKQVLEILFKTLCFYNTRGSRQGVCNILKVFFSSTNAPQHLETFKTFAVRQGYLAPTALGVLLEWCAIALEFDQRVAPIQAVLLERYLASNQSKSRRATIIGRVRRSIQNQTKILQFLPRPTQAYSPYLGVVSVYEADDKYYVDFFIKELLGSKTPIPAHVAHGLDPFFANATSTTMDGIVPSMEKAILRAPEIVLDRLLPAVFGSYKGPINAPGLLKGLLSAIKSSNLVIRNGSISSLIPLIKRLDESSAFANELVILLGKSKSPELRQIYATLLVHFQNLDEKCFAMVESIASKESNEAALDAEARILSSAASTRPFLVGLKDKRPGHRRIWALRGAELSIEQAFDATIHEVQANPVVAASNGLITVATIATAKNRKETSYLTNPRVYSKIVEEEDLLWFLRALEAQKLDEALVHALIFMITSTKIHEAASASLQRFATPLTLPLIVNGIWSYRRLHETRLDQALCAVQGALSLDQPCLLAILCREPLVSRINWIKLNLGNQVDPRTLVSRRAVEYLEHIKQNTGSQDASESQIFQAACDCAAELAFVDPSFVSPLTALIESELECNVTEDQVAIANDETATARVNGHADKSLQRTEDIRKGKQISDQQTRLVTQQEVEAEIRKVVVSTRLRIARAFGLIEALVRGPPTDSATWLRSSSKLLLAINGGAALLHPRATEVFLACANKISPRFGLFRRAIGLALLYTCGGVKGDERDQIGTLRCGTMLTDLVTRVLYRLRFSSDQFLVDLPTFNYVLPLIMFILREGGFGVTGEAADEQLTLAIEFCNLHFDHFSSQDIAADFCSLIITCVRKHPQLYRLLKDCLLGISQRLPGTTGQVNSFLEGCAVPESSVRALCLQAIANDLDLDENRFHAEIWIAMHEEDKDNAALATSIWQENALVPGPAKDILPYLSYSEEVRTAASRALAELEVDFAQLTNLYNSKITKGAIRKQHDDWEPRHGVALTFLAYAHRVEDLSLIRFLLNGPVSDGNAKVRSTMVEAGREMAAHCRQVQDLQELLEGILASSQDDRVHEASIIMYGALAVHLVVKGPAVERLLKSLDTPSESVQFAISQCLSPITADISSDQVQSLITQLSASSFASRRGAAYGLSGIVQGLGLAAFRKYRIMPMLRTLSREKDPKGRQGAFMAVELIMSGCVFEPYVIQTVPLLLAGFGDASADVRLACLDAAKTCFRSLSSFGVKQILPLLLDGLDEQAWRSKKGACDSLGAMAYLDPQQLAENLPKIIPPLTSVLTDSHKEVRNSANQSLQRFGEVISNPEVKSVVDQLLKALSDPSHTEQALDALLKVNFVHYLDAPSLALIVRILERGLADRSGTKRKASQVIGSLAHLTERSALLPHLPLLVAGVRTAVVDPVPATRATASKALGSLVEKLGEDALPDLIPSLMAKLKTDTGAGDRLGSAQALSEVLTGLGTTRLEETLPSIIQNASSSKASIREGFMSLFIYLPACFGTSFAGYLNRIIPPILSGLADEVESIRDTSLRAGRLLVKNFATKAIDLFLPELQKGLADENHRIRLSSVELVGELLFTLLGVSGEEEVNSQPLLEVLGEEKRNNILAALYICRCDTSGLVKAAASNVWKALVSTPRMLKDITPTLTQVIIRRLASSNSEQKLIAGNALGELVRKSGEAVLASLLPTLSDGLQSTDVDARQGICIALRELVSSASEEMLEEHEQTLVSVVRSALADPNADVREAAAEAFDSMQAIFGKRVVDQTLPHLLSLLHDNSQNALSALLTLLTEQTRANIILPSLLPTLLATPMSVFNANAIGSLASVAGSALNRRLKQIIERLVDEEIVAESERKLALFEALKEVVLSVDEHELGSLMSVMNNLLKHHDHRKRATANRLMAEFCASDVDYARYHADLIRNLLIAFDDSDRTVVKEAWTALHMLTSRLSKEELESCVVSTRTSLNHVGVVGHALPGFQLPRGIQVVLTIFLQGLVNGNAEQRTQAALGIADVIDKSDADALKPFVAQITGPLIRIISERSIDVKVAVLHTLCKLLERIPLLLRPFLPQLQRTFTKSLAEPSIELRDMAAKALGALIKLTPRVDPLIGELVAGARSNDEDVKAAMQKALFEVVKAGSAMSDASRASIVSLVEADGNPRLLGALVKSVTPDVAANLIRARVLREQAPGLALNAILLDSPETLTAFDIVPVIAKRIQETDDVEFILAAGKYLLSTLDKSFDVVKPLFEALAAAIGPARSIDSRRLGLVVIRTVSRIENELIRPHLSLLAPLVFGSVRDPVIPVKISAEAAFITMFDVIGSDSTLFDKFLLGAGSNMAPNTKRSMSDYFKRVALRLASQQRENVGNRQDEEEDEREIWSVGKLDMNVTAF